MNQLKTVGTFVQIARSLSLTKAAEELGISRSLVTNHLKQLEEHLGVLLVNRTTRQVVLTEAGSEYLTFCMEALERFEAAEASISKLQNEPQGRLKIMSSMAFGTLQLAPSIRAFNEKYSQVKVSLMLFDRGFSAPDFIEGGYDLGISLHPMQDAGIISVKVAEVSWVACATKRYLSTHPPIKVPADLQAHNCLVHRRHAADSIWRFSGSQGPLQVRVTGSLFTNSALVLRDAVLAHAGVAMLPLYAVRSELSAGKLIRVLADYDGLIWPVFIVYPQVRYLPKRTRLFIDFLRAELKRRHL